MAKQKKDPPSKVPLNAKSKFASEIMTNCVRIETILRTPIFEEENNGHPLRESAFTEVMIRLDDLLQKAKRFVTNEVGDDLTIHFDDPDFVDGDDINKLVNDIRNAVCHIGSGSHIFQQMMRFTGNSMTGNAVDVIINGVEYRSADPNDTAFYFGDRRIYLKRHIWRAYAELNKVLVPLINLIPEKVEEAAPGIGEN